MMSGHGRREDDEQVADEGELAVNTGSDESSRSADPRTARLRGLPSRRSAAQDAEAPLDDRAGPGGRGGPRLAHRIVDLAADKKASDIVLLDVRGQTTMTDYFVICSGASDRQLGAIADGIVEGLHDDGARPLSREGDASSHWVLLDFGGVIVHVMSVPGAGVLPAREALVTGRPARSTSSSRERRTAPGPRRCGHPIGRDRSWYHRGMGTVRGRHRSIQSSTDRTYRSSDKDG